MPGGRRKIRNVILSKRQNRPREKREKGRKDGGGRKYANPAGIQECRMKAGKRVSATLCRPPRNAVRTDAAPASARGGERLAKRQSDFARGKSPTRRKKPSEAPFFPAFHTPANFFAARNSRLCGKKKISFSKEIPFSPHKNGYCGGEMLHTSSSPALFLTLRGLFSPYRPIIPERNRAEFLTFWQHFPGFSYIPALARQELPSRGSSTPL